MEKGIKAIHNSLLRAVSVPALNKWTKVFPCAGAVVLLVHFHTLARDAFKDMFGALSEQDDESDSEEGSEDRALAVPANEAKRRRKLARKRNKKAAHFVVDEDCGFLNMLWVFISKPVMTLHWSLFRNATWYSDRPDPAERADGKDKVHQIAAFCEPVDNPALKVSEELMKLLAQPDEQLHVMCFFLWRLPSLVARAQTCFQIGSASDHRSVDSQARRAFFGVPLAFVAHVLFQVFCGAAARMCAAILARKHLLLRSWLFRSAEVSDRAAVAGRAATGIPGISVFQSGIDFNIH